MLDGQKLQFHPNMFYLEWPAPGTDGTPSARWCNVTDVPKDKVAFGSYVKWTDLRTEIFVATNYKTKERFSCLASNPYHNVAYLKSHLQKCIRRSNAAKAIKTTQHFMDLDTHDCLRRLAIIAIEDCLPLEGFSILVWLMSALSKGYLIDNAQYCWILGYVNDLAHCKYYEQLPHADDGDGPGTKEMRLLSLPTGRRDLVYSILFRQSYGGMKSDKGMCRVAALVWANRLHTGSRFLELLERKTIYITPPVTELTPNEWIIGAIDFHCCPNIISAMWEKHDDLDQGQIKSAIWHCSSSLTDKLLLTDDLGQRRAGDQELLAIWKTIRNDFSGYGKFMLSKQG